MDQAIFRNQALNESFSREGYVVLDVFTDDQMQDFQKYFGSFHADISGHFHSSHFSDNLDYKKAVNRYFNEIAKEALIPLLLEYQAVFSNFMVKDSHPESTMSLHADWTYVDEENFTSLACWFPLISTNEKNGCLGVIPKSHKLPINFRGPKIPSPFHAENEKIIRHFGQLLHMKAGQVIIYDHRLLHYSPANLSGQVRPAINIVLLPKNVEVFHYLKQTSSDKKTIKYSVEDTDFYMHYTHFKTPEKINKTEFLDQIVQPISFEKVQDILNEKRSPFLERLLKKLF
jgi:hypothetical protein